MIELNNKEKVSDNHINYFYGTVTYCSDESINYRPDIKNGPTPGNDFETSVFADSYKDEDVKPYVGQYIIILVNYKGRDFTRRNYVIYDAANYEEKMGLNAQSSTAGIHR